MNKDYPTWSAQKGKTFTQVHQLFDYAAAFTDLIIVRTIWNWKKVFDLVNNYCVTLTFTKDFMTPTNIIINTIIKIYPRRNDLSS